MKSIRFKEQQHFLKLQPLAEDCCLHILQVTISKMMVNICQIFQGIILRNTVNGKQNVCLTFQVQLQ